MTCSWNGKLLWPSKQTPAARQCLHCGSQQVFEMQILAPLLHFLEETCTWLIDDDNNSHCSEQIATAMQALSNWQWLTVAIFSCPNACQAGHCEPIKGIQCVWQEQTVMLAMEE